MKAKKAHESISRIKVVVVAVVYIVQLQHGRK